jgi:hypothetical protein
LQNHREVLAAMDFFNVPTVTFRVQYCFFVIEHERRKILHCNRLDCARLVAVTLARNCLTIPHSDLLSLR